MIQAVIFDLDGTILNSLELRIEAWKHAFSQYGVNLSDDTLRPLIGLPGIVIAKMFSEKAQEIDIEEERYFRSHLNELRLFDDVNETFSTLGSKGIKTGIVTSSKKAFMKILNLPYKPVITIDDVGFGKPDPEPYLKILEIMKVKPENAAFVGDAESDLVPAREIKSVSVLIRHGSNKASENADYYIDNVSEILKLVSKLEKLRKKS